MLATATTGGACKPPGPKRRDRMVDNWPLWSMMFHIFNKSRNNWLYFGSAVQLKGKWRKLLFQSWKEVFWIDQARWLCAVWSVQGKGPLLTSHFAAFIQTTHVVCTCTLNIPSSPIAPTHTHTSWLAGSFTLLDSYFHMFFFFLFFSTNHKRGEASRGVRKPCFDCHCLLFNPIQYITK